MARSLWPEPVCGSATRSSAYSPAMTETALEEAALIYEAAAAELDQAESHCRTAAHHFRESEIPRAAAHAWAAFGHVRIAEDSLEDQARTHARKSKPV